MKKYLLNIIMVSGLCTIPLYAEPATTEEVATLQKSIDTLDALTEGSSGDSVALTTPTDGTKLSRTTAPTIDTAPSSTTYLLYASTEPTFSSGNTII